MENRVTRYIYDHSPVWAQHLYSSAFGLSKRLKRYGAAYRRYMAFFKQSANWSLADLHAFQDEQVRLVVQDAYEHVPFHRRRMEQCKLKPADISGAADLPKLPLLTKTDLRQAGEQMLSTEIPKRRIRSASTSGSTGFPLVNYWTAEAEQREYGFFWARRRLNIQRGQRYGSFTGLQILRADSLQPPFWRYNFAAGQVCYSIFHMTPQTMASYAEHIRRTGLRYLEGYPSAIAELGRFIATQHLAKPEQLVAVFTTSEQLLPEQQRWIEEGFGTRVYDQYGQNEKAGSITEYECGHKHYDMDYSVLEFLPTEQHTDSGQAVCEIVCTAFGNPAFPLIRYRVGDLAVLSAEPVACQQCPSPIVESIFGRTAQTLISRDGRRISNISVIAKRCHHVEAMQCVQEQPGMVTIRVLKGAEFTADDGREILRQFGLKMGQMDFDIEYVDRIERTASGKFLSIVSKILPERLASEAGGLSCR